jgi:Flp pilus assembly protein TadD
VRAFGDQGELRREESYVHVLATEDAAAVRAALARIGDSAGGANAPATRFLSGSYLSGSGLYGEAAAQFEALSRLSPDSPAPHEALGNVYRAVGLMDLAAAEYQQALTLSR